MDVKSLIQFLFASISMEILWSQTEVSAMTMPDCHSLGKDFAELQRSGEEKFWKYEKIWDEFFHTARKNFESQSEKIDNKCPVKRKNFANDYMFSVGKKDRAKVFKMLDEKLYKNRKINEHDKTSFQTYIGSTTIQDQIELSKFVEEKCEVVVLEFWQALNHFEWAINRNRGCNERPIPENWYDCPLSSTEIDASKFNIDNANDIFQSAVIMYRHAFDEFSEVIRGELNITRVLRIFDYMKGKQLKHINNRVFFRGVQRMKRIERKLLKNYVLRRWRIEAMFNKKRALYRLWDIESIVREMIDDDLQHFIVADVMAYRLRLRILIYQVNYTKYIS